MGTKNIRMTDEMMSACEKYAAEYNASSGKAFADSVIKHYNADRNMKIVTGVANLFYYAGSIFEDSAAKDDPAQTWDGVDSKLKREIEQKKRGEMKMV